MAAALADGGVFHVLLAWHVNEGWSCLCSDPSFCKVQKHGRLRFMYLKLQPEPSHGADSNCAGSDCEVGEHAPRQ